jgi:mannan endo-1,4-beta-mannosidase
MKTTFLKIALISLSVMTMVCCSSDKEADDAIVIIDPPTQSDPLTTQNVTNYMVDANATKETVALFYNLKKLAKTKFAIGQQDAFNSFYQDAGGDSDIKKNSWVLISYLLQTKTITIRQITGFTNKSKKQSAM